MNIPYGNFIKERREYYLFGHGITHHIHPGLKIVQPYIIQYSDQAKIHPKVDNKINKQFGKNSLIWRQ